MRSFILDTGMLLGLTRGQQWAKAAFDLLELHDPETTVFTSVICHGEMLALHKRLLENGWSRWAGAPGHAGGGGGSNGFTGPRACG